jgi:SAM-dependent methyltransferase
MEATLSTPFTDPALIRDTLYGTADRLGQRTTALHRAKIMGADATETIAAMAMAANPAPARVADIGCGRGTTTVRLAQQYPTAALIAVDQSPALLNVVGTRLSAHRHQLHLVQADFHHLPDKISDVDLAVAAFCLYHSPRPERALTEIADRLAAGGTLIVTTKSADSYHEIDAIIAARDLDPGATGRPSLYHSFHSSNAADLLDAAGLVIRCRVDQQHVFRFADATHLAEYVTTCPKYQLPTELTTNPAALADALRHGAPNRTLTTTSTVTYLVVSRP